MVAWILTALGGLVSFETQRANLLCKIYVAKLPGVMLLQDMELPCGDLVALDAVRVDMERAHVLDKAASNRRR